MKRKVHFILTGGDIGPCERRAILSAKVHGAPIVLWYTGDKPDVDGLDISLEHIRIPAWLASGGPHSLYFSSRQRCHIFDTLSYLLAYEQGGLFLQLDTISIRPAWDLLPEDKDVVVSEEWPANDPEILITPDKLAYPYQAMFLARKDGNGALALYEEAKRRVINEPEIWGYTGPYMLSDFVNHDERVGKAPFPSLCGWAPGYCWRFYLGLETPGIAVRVIHLYQVCYRSLYERRYGDWAQENPHYAGEVARRTDVNERLLRCP